MTVPDEHNYIEYGARVRWDDGTVVDLPRGSRKVAQATVDMHTSARAENPKWRATAELIQRTITITTSPWATTSNTDFPKEES